MQNKTKLSSEITAVKDAYLTGRVVPDREIALASMTVLDEYRHLPYPSVPTKVKEYYDLKRDARKKMNDSPESYLGFWNDPIVKNFFDEKQKIKNLNERNKSWLEWMKNVLSEEGDEHDLEITMKLNGFGDTGPVDQPDWSN